MQRQQTLTLRDEQELALCKHITRIYTSRRMVYGSRKVHQTLRADGVRIGRNRVRRIMREQGLYGIRKPRAFKNRAGASASTLLPNVLNRQFTAMKPNEKWLTDFTHIRISGGLDIYLAVVLDTFSRKVVGWAVSPKRAGVAQSRRHILRANQQQGCCSTATEEQTTHHRSCICMQLNAA